MFSQEEGVCSYRQRLCRRTRGIAEQVHIVKLLWFGVFSFAVQYTLVDHTLGRGRRLRGTCHSQT